jgi:hypothetical protein
LVAFGAETQKLNLTEKNVTFAQNLENSVITSLAEKLKKITRIMESYVTPHALPSEEYLMDEDSSGSGHLDSLIDDEDYAVETGSGSGDGSDSNQSTTNRINTDIVFAGNERNDDKVSQIETDSSFRSIRPNLLLLLIVSLLAFQKKVPFN